jgi:DNA-binding response OmpR family regulator
MSPPIESNGDLAQPKAILVVDDERPICDVLAELLQDEGYDVSRAYDGLAALATAERHRPDLVLSDVMMPGLDGVSLVRRLHERGLRPSVILMSAVYDDVDLPRVCFVPKPFDVDDLLGTIERLLGSAPAADARIGISRLWRPHWRARRRARQGRHHPQSTLRPA